MTRLRSVLPGIALVGAFVGLVWGCGSPEPVTPQQPTTAPVTQVTPVGQATNSSSVAPPAASSVSPPAAVPVRESDDVVCFMPLSQAHYQQLTPLVVPQPGTSQNVCLLEQEPDGEFEQQYYQESDGFADFWYYALLARTARTATFTYGVIADPTDLEYITLMYLTPVDKYGHAFTSYELDKKTGKWSSRKTDKPITIKQVKLGKAPAVKPNTAATPPPVPPAYVPQPNKVSQGSTTPGRDAEKRNVAPPVAPKPQVQKQPAPAPKPKR